MRHLAGSDANLGRMPENTQSDFELIGEQERVRGVDLYASLSQFLCFFGATLDYNCSTKGSDLNE